MGLAGPADPAGRVRWPRPPGRHARNLQWHPLRLTLRLQLAHAAPRLAPVGHPCTTITAGSARTALSVSFLSTCAPRCVGRPGVTRVPARPSWKRQSVKTTRKGGPERGYDPAKKVKGRKRHLLVDTLGLILAVVVHAADPGEREGARRLLELVLKAKQAGRGCFERLKHVWVDAGYQGKEWLAGSRWPWAGPWRSCVSRVGGSGAPLTSNPRRCRPSRCSNAAG
jgi:transposase